MPKHFNSARNEHLKQKLRIRWGQGNEQARLQPANSLSAGNARCMKSKGASVVQTISAFVWREAGPHAHKTCMGEREPIYNGK